MKLMNTSAITFILATIIRLNVQAQSPDNWEWLHPKPQGNSIFAIDFVDNSNGYAAGQFGTLLRTKDAGISWITMNSGTSRFIFCVDFLDADTGYIGGERQMLKKTTDGGHTWTALSLPVEGPLDTLLEVLDVLFVTPSVGYATGQFSIECKLWKTTNGGQNWVTQNIPEVIILRSLYFLDENSGFAVGGALGSEIIKTTDGGLNWLLIDNVPGAGMEGVQFLNATTGLAGGAEGNIVRTTDEGDTWQLVGTPSFMDFTSIDFIDANTGFAFGKGSDFFTTTNGGVTWVEAPLGFGSYREYHDAAITPDGTIHVAGSHGMIIRSTNLGTSFTHHPFATERSIADIHFLNTSTGYAVCDAPDGDIIKTTDAGETWTSQVTQYTPGLRGVTFVSATTGYAVGGLVIKKTLDGGNSWVDILTHPSNSYWDVTFLDDAIGFVVGGGSAPFIMKTTNAGSNWNTTVFSPGFNALTSICFVDSNHGYAVGGLNIAVRTTNGGASWSNMSVAPGSSYSTVFFVNASTGYISSSDGMYKTTNGGNSWLAVNVPSGAYNKVQFKGGIGYAVASNGTIAKSTDGGDTWFVQPTNTDNSLAALFISPDNFVYAGGSGGTLIKAFPSELGTPTTHQYDLSEGWNLVSVPLAVSDFRKSTLFPSSISEAFAFHQTSGYAPHDTLGNGIGYWIKFAGAQSLAVAGIGRDTDTIAVASGWNMIGSVTSPIVISLITSIPPGIVTSSFFEYLEMYSVTDTISPGRGYWMKANQDGLLILSSAVPSTQGNRIRIVPTGEVPPPPPDGGKAGEHDLLIQGSLPTEFQLGQNYPNPFNPSTTIMFSLPQYSFTNLGVFDLLGQEVTTLISKELEPGTYNVQWNAAGFPSGFYFYRLRAGGFTEVKKMILMK